MDVRALLKDDHLNSLSIAKTNKIGVKNISNNKKEQVMNNKWTE